MKDQREVRQMTMAQIRALPNMLGVLATAAVKRTGHYDCVIGDKPVRIEAQR